MGERLYSAGAVMGMAADAMAVSRARVRQGAASASALRDAQAGLAVAQARLTTTRSRLETARAKLAATTAALDARRR